MVGGNNLFKQNNKSWAVVLGVLMLAIIGLVAGLIVVNINHERELAEKELQESRKRTEIGNDATARCNELNSLYENGASPLNITKQYFENSISESDDDIYKMYITICYADFVYDVGEGIDVAVEIMDRLKPMIDDNATIRMGYYTELASLYKNDDNMEMFNYYNDIVYEYNEAEKLEDE